MGSEVALSLSEASFGQVFSSQCSNVSGSRSETSPGLLLRTAKIQLTMMKASILDDIHLLFQRIEVVNDDPDEEVEGEEGAADDEDDKVEVVVEARFILRLLVNLTNAKTITNITKYYTNTDDHGGVFSSLRC